jgi:AraC-like DNA-binding protein
MKEVAWETAVCPPGSSALSSFTDVGAYQAAIRSADTEIVVTARGGFHAELTRITLNRLWIQRSEETLPSVSHFTTHTARAPIFFLAGADQAATKHSGIEIYPGDIVVYGSGKSHHHQTSAECQWGSMSLAPHDLSAASCTLTGREFCPPSDTQVITPPPALISRLWCLHEYAGYLARTTPDILAHPEVARAFEEALIHAMVCCLTDAASPHVSIGRDRHLKAMRRFEDLLAAHPDQPFYLPEVCAAIGISGRTLRVCCQEHLGMGPIRYLWLRRMHLARREFLLADPEATTVAEIATGKGFWELGRFSVAYRTLFGESPSATLRRVQ